MTIANARFAIILAGFLALGLGSLSQTASAETPEGFSQAELDQMLAPIALYPDTVLSHVLIAATYPLEVVQAARWSRANPGLSGEFAVDAVEYQPWDPSVMALVAFPELLARMDADLGWTQRLGDAFLIQEYQVLDTIQYLRDEAYASGHLRSNEYVRVVRETEYIYIEPSVTRVVYVPWYDPYTVYGDWRWSAYPPVYWHQPRGYRSGFSFYWGSGHRLDYGFFFSAVHWPSHRLVVHDHHGYYKRHDKRYRKHGYVAPRFSSGRELARHESARHWTHDRDHRRGVAYRRGIDERHTIRAADGASARNGNHRRSELGNDRRDLLRQRSADISTQGQRSRSVASDSNPRTRGTSNRSLRDRNSTRRDADSVLDVARSRRDTSGRPDRDTASRASARASDRQPSLRGDASSRREISQRRNTQARSQKQSTAREAGSSRARDMRSRPPAQRSLSRTRPEARNTPRDRLQSRVGTQPRPESRSRPQPSPRSKPALRAEATRNVGPGRTQARAPSESRRSAARSSGRAISRQAHPGSTSRASSAGAPSRSVRAEAPRQARSEGKSNRAEMLRSRRGKRDQ